MFIIFLKKIENIIFKKIWHLNKLIKLIYWPLFTRFIHLNKKEKILLFSSVRALNATYFERVSDFILILDKSMPKQLLNFISFMRILF